MLAGQTLRIVPLIWAAIYLLAAFALFVQAHWLAWFIAAILSILAIHSIYIGTKGKRRFDIFDWQNQLNSSTIVDPEITECVIQEFFLKDRISAEKFIATYRAVVPLVESPSYPLWFAAAYPDVIRFVQETSKAMLSGTASKAVWRSEGDSPDTARDIFRI